MLSANSDRASAAGPERPAPCRGQTGGQRARESTIETRDEENGRSRHVNADRHKPPDRQTNRTWPGGGQSCRRAADRTNVKKRRAYKQGGRGTKQTAPRSVESGRCLDGRWKVAKMTACWKSWSLSCKWDLASLRLRPGRVRTDRGGGCSEDQTNTGSRRQEPRYDRAHVTFALVTS